MADTEEEVLVKIEDEPAPEGAAAEKSNTPDPVAVFHADYDEIKKTAEAEKTRREAAERREAEARRNEVAARKEAETFRTESVDSQFDAVTTGLNAAESEATSAEGEYASLMEKGDFVGAAKAQRRIASAEAKILRFNEAKADLEARKTAPRTEERTERVRDDKGRFVSDDPVEQFLATRTEPTANWLREHRDWLTDSRKSKKLTAADADAQAEGHSPDTPAYFDYVERFLGLKKEEASKVDGTTNGATPPKRAAAPPVAPVNGGGGAHSSGSSNGAATITLTRGEANAANDGMTHVWGKHDLAAGRIKDASLIGKAIGNQEFARRKLAMQRAGAYDKSYTEN